MTTFGKTLTVGIIAVIIILGIAVLGLTSGTIPSGTSTTTPPAATTTPPVSSGTLYSNSDLGFSFRYPASLSVLPQNFMDTTGSKTLITLANADKSDIIRVSILNDPKTGKPISPDVGNYEKALIANTVFDGSGANPKSFSEFELRKLGDARFAYIKTGLFEAVLSVDYFATVPDGIVRFSLVSHIAPGVVRPDGTQDVSWMDPSFDIEKDPGHLALKAMLATFKVGAYSEAAPAVSLVSYTDPSATYSLQVPSSWKVNPKFQYENLSPDKKIPGVSFSIPVSMTAGTNLGVDSYLSIEKNPYAQACVPDEFSSASTTDSGTTDTSLPGILWTIGKSNDAGAGNYYDERIFTYGYRGTCYGIRLFLHSGNVDNFDPGAVQQFNASLFESIQNKAAASFNILK